MELSIWGDQDAKLEVSEQTFGVDFNRSLVHQIVVAYLAAARSGTKAQKTRGEVAGSTKKMWRQKGTGRARVGAASSPLWRSGGMIFASKPRSFEHKVNRKMYRGAMRSILSELVRSERLIVTEAFSVADFKTRSLKHQLQQIGVENLLIIDVEISRDLELSSRNIPNIKVLSVNHLNPVDLVKFKKTLMTVSALKRLEELLSC